MAKDPAFLFYSSDFLTGTMFMNNEQVGKYIRLLCAQHQIGHLSEQHMLNICGSYDEQVFSKFKRDESGKYYNERCEAEITKRKAYSDSRRANRKAKSKDMNNISTTYVKHMENENENENENEVSIKSIDERKLNFKSQLAEYLPTYGSVLLNAFYLYWTEMNPGGKKMRFEMQKVFQISRRLVTWSNNNKFNATNAGKFKTQVVSGLERIKARYGESPTEGGGSGAGISGADEAVKIIPIA